LINNIYIYTMSICIQVPFMTIHADSLVELFTKEREQKDRNRLSRRRYEKSEKGKASRKRANAKYQAKLKAKTALVA
jgi:hypothetical protein